MSGYVAVSAHRGGAEDHPQDTLEAYRSAMAAGVDYVEFDVRRLGDGTLVCYHDHAAGAASTPLRKLAYPELCKLVGYEVPTVVGLLSEVAGKAAGHVDLKETGYEDEVVRLARDMLGEEGFVATTLEDASIARITAEFPPVRTALSLGRSRDEIPTGALLSTRLSELFPLRRIRSCGANRVAMNKTLARYGVLRQCARHGIGAMVWTVDDGELIEQLLTDPRVDVLVTNRPRYAIELRDRQQ